MRRFKTLVELDGEAGLWVTYVPALNHLSTFGKTEDEALQKTREAIQGYLEAAQKDGIPLPEADENLRLVDIEVSAS